MTVSHMLIRPGFGGKHDRATGSGRQGPTPGERVCQISFIEKSGCKPCREVYIKNLVYRNCQARGFVLEISLCD